MGVNLERTVRQIMKESHTGDAAFTPGATGKVLEVLSNERCTRVYVFGATVDTAWRLSKSGGRLKRLF